MKTKIILTLALYAVTNFPPLGGQRGACQNIGINTTGAAPDASAMLDIDATNKGLLIPRVALTSTTDVVTIPTPATSLLVYNTNAAMTGGAVGYWYWNGANWVSFSGSGGNAWLLLGNAGTVDGTNFIGTTDNIPFNIRVNNQRAGRINSSGMTFLGYQAGNSNTASDNTGIGYHALFSNTSGGGNTAIGWNALQANTTGIANTVIGRYSLQANTTGNANTATGLEALRDNTTGSFNTATGLAALSKNTTGNNNTATGYGALAGGNPNTGNGNTANGASTLTSVTTGNYNTGIGFSVLQLNSTGSNNTATGYYSLLFNTGGSYNTASGVNALYANTNGNYNTANGYLALDANTTGSNNTAVGYNAFGTGSAYSNSTALGANTVIGVSNKVRLGDALVTVIEGQVAYTFPSDGRFKNNVTEEVPGLDFINKLRPIVYNFDTRKFDAFLLKTLKDSLRESIMSKKDYSESSSIRQSGFIAQEVEQAMKESGYDFNGVHKPASESDNYSIAYSLFVVPLVKAVQEQQVIIDSLKLENVALKSEIKNLMTSENKLQTSNEMLKSDYENRLKKLEEILDTIVEKINKQ